MGFTEGAFPASSRRFRYLYLSFVGLAILTCLLMAASFLPISSASPRRRAAYCGSSRSCQGFPSAASPALTAPRLRSLEGDTPTGGSSRLWKEHTGSPPSPRAHEATRPLAPATTEAAATSSAMAGSLPSLGRDRREPENSGGGSGWSRRAPSAQRAAAATAAGWYRSRRQRSPGGRDCSSCSLSGSESGLNSRLPALAERDRHEPDAVLVEEPVADQRGGEVGAAEDEEILPRLLFQSRHRLSGVLLHQRAVGPVGALERARD